MSSSSPCQSNNNHNHNNDNERYTSTMVSATVQNTTAEAVEVQVKRQGRPPQSRNSPPATSPASSTSSETSSASPSPPFNSSSSFQSQTFPTRLYVNTLYKSGPRIQQARRIKWTPELQDRFLRCVERLGKTAVPSRILAEMNVEGLSRSQVASHLHQFRKQTDQEEQQMYETPQSLAASESSSSQLVPSTTLSSYRHDQDLFSALSTSTLFPSISIESTYDTNYSDFYVRMLYQNSLLQRPIPTLSGPPSYLLPPYSEQQPSSNPSESPLEYLNLVDDFWTIPNSTAATQPPSDWNYLPPPPSRNPPSGL